MTATVARLDGHRRRPLPVVTPRPAGARLIIGPWRQVWPVRVTPWGRGRSHRLAPDRGQQLSLFPPTTTEDDHDRAQR